MAARSQNDEPMKDRCSGTAKGKEQAGPGVGLRTRGPRDDAGLCDRKAPRRDCGRGDFRVSSGAVSCVGAAAGGRCRVCKRDKVADEVAVQFFDGLGFLSAAGLTDQCGLHGLAVPLAWMTRLQTSPFHTPIYLP